MRKALIASAVATLFAMPTVVLAEDAPAASPLSFNVGVTSDYLFRGVSQTRGAPAVFGGVDYAFSNGIYVGAWASSITWVKDWLGSGSMELDLYGGYKSAIGNSDWSYDVGMIHYNYPSHGSSTKGSVAVPAPFGQLANPNTTEVYGAISYKWLTMKYSQAVSTHFIGWVPTTAAGVDPTRNSKGSNYLELNAAYDLGDGWGISGHVGHQKVKNVVAVTAYGPDADYTDWNIGVTKDVGFGVVGLTYSDTNAKGTCGNPVLGGTNNSAYCWGSGMNTATPSGFKDVAQGTAVLSFKKTF